MATTRNQLFFPAILMLIFIMSLDFTAAQIGVFYGRNGDGLPPPSQVVAIFKRYGIKRMRIYEPFPPTLEALRGTDIELTVSAPNDQLQRLRDRASADTWVRDNIQKYPSVKFKHVVVGNEISPIRHAELVPYVVPAMQNIRGALVAAGLGRIAVTTAVETEVLDPSKNFPPSKGEFRPEVKQYMQSILQFLVNTNAPLFANIYPYYAYIANNGVISLDYALLKPGAGINTEDGFYDNLYYALLDTMYAAVEKTGVSSLQDSGGVTNTEIKGGESGWGSGGGGSPPAAATLKGDGACVNSSGGGSPGAAAPNKKLKGESGWNSGGRRNPGATAVADQSGAAAANPQNAATYVNNLIRVVKKGTPRRPNRPIETYIFAMFDENRKPSGERNFGIFQPNGNTKFPINFN